MTEQQPPEQRPPGEPTAQQGQAGYAPPYAHQGQPGYAPPYPHQGQAGYPPPYPYPPPYAYSPPINTYAILALVLAVAVFPPLGIYFGHKARAQIAQSGERGSELATAGIVIGWIITAIWCAFLLAWCGIAGVMIARS